jgi:type II secretory pathway pseudopilin PulG
MLTLNEPFSFLPCKQGKKAGFTLMELTFAVALFSAFAVVSILAFTTFNRFASNARYETLALAVAREKMDEVMTAPCNLNSNSSNGPILYLSGTTVSPLSSGTSYSSIVETSLPLNNDTYNLTRTITSGTSNNVPLTITLTGTTAAGSLDTQVIDSRTTTFASVPGNMRELNVSVAVAYTYRGKQFTITLSSIRATDNF